MSAPPCHTEGCPVTCQLPQALHTSPEHPGHSFPWIHRRDVAKQRCRGDTARASGQGFRFAGAPWGLQFECVSLLWCRAGRASEILEMAFGLLQGHMLEHGPWSVPSLHKTRSEAERRFFIEEAPALSWLATPAGLFWECSGLWRGRLLRGAGLRPCRGGDQRPSELRPPGAILLSTWPPGPAGCLLPGTWPGLGWGFSSALTLMEGRSRGGSCSGRGVGGKLPGWLLGCQGGK